MKIVRSEEIENSEWKILSSNTWRVRDNSHILSKTKVGAAILSVEGNIHCGCNVQTIYRSDLHAEVNAISNMFANGDKEFSKILISAEREKFTPCGACLDWIVQFGVEGCEVAIQNSPNGDIHIFTIDELIPHYPR